MIGLYVLGWEKNINRSSHFACYNLFFFFFSAFSLPSGIFNPQTSRRRANLINVLFRLRKKQRENRLARRQSRRKQAGCRPQVCWNLRAKSEITDPLSLTYSGAWVPVVQRSINLFFLSMCLNWFLFLYLISGIWEFAIIRMHTILTN